MEIKNAGLGRNQYVLTVDKGDLKNCSTCGKFTDGFGYFCETKDKIFCKECEMKFTRPCNNSVQEEHVHYCILLMEAK